MKFWSVKPLLTKQSEEVTDYFHPDHEGLITTTDTYTRCVFHIQTNDDQPPRFAFKRSGSRFVIDGLNCRANNIIDSEVIGLFASCESTESFPSSLDDELIESIELVAADSGIYEALEMFGWIIDETRVFVWGPLVIENVEGDDDFRMVVAADEYGNCCQLSESDWKTFARDDVTLNLFG